MCIRDRDIVPIMSLPIFSPEEIRSFLLICGPVLTISNMADEIDMPISITAPSEASIIPANKSPLKSKSIPCGIYISITASSLENPVRLEMCIRDRNLSAAETGRKAESKRKKISSNLILKKINDGKKVIAVELDPPSDTNIDSFFENAKILKKHNVDAITIADCPIAVSYTHLDVYKRQVPEMV